MEELVMAETVASKTICPPVGGRSNLPGTPASANFRRISNYFHNFAGPSLAGRFFRGFPKKRNVLRNSRSAVPDQSVAAEFVIAFELSTDSILPVDHPDAIVFGLH